MKFTIMGFSQKRALEFKLDTTDLFILRYFIDFRDSNKMVKIIDGDTPYYWFKYEGFVEEYPILDLKKDTIYRRMKKLADCGILKHKTVTSGGKYSYYSLGNKYIELLSDSNPNLSDSVPNHTDSNPIPYGLKSGTNNPSTIYPSTISNIDSSTEEKNVDRSKADEIVKYLNSKAGTNYKSSSAKTKSLISARIKDGFTLDDFKTVIDKKVVEWINDDKMCKYLRPETLFGTKFEGYLNEKKATVGNSSKNKFNNFEPRNKNYEQLEEDLREEKPIEEPGEDIKPQKGINLDKFYNNYTKSKQI